MYIHQKKIDPSLIVLTLIMLMILGYFAIQYRTEKELKTQIIHEISLLPSDYFKYCRPELKEEIDSFKRGPVTYKQMQ